MPELLRVCKTHTGLGYHCEIDPKEGVADLLNEVLKCQVFSQYTTSL
jgi:hypothetical protein